MKKITIIGGGASGTLLVTNLLKLATGEVEINFVDRRERIGRGVAFGTQISSHLLNVPAGRMGAFPDDHGHFHQWLTAAGHEYDSHDFVPRVLFGRYLREVFEQEAARAGKDVRLNIIDDEAIDLSVNADSAEVMLHSGEILHSDTVVLAFGNFTPPHPSVPDLSFTASPDYFQDPWSSRFYDSLEPDRSVFIIGTGLSMVDVAVELRHRKHRGKIYAISTRGLLPAVHELGHSFPAFDDELDGLERITDMLKIVRKKIRSAEAAGSNWRAVIDALRPITQKLWLTMPLAEKVYFKQHLSRYWNVARHRMPPAAAEILNEMQSEGSLTVLKGRLRSIARTDAGFEVDFRTPTSSDSIRADVLVNCIGSEANFARIDTPFVRSLIERRHIRPDALMLGMDATPDGRVIGRDGMPSDVVRTLGTALKGILWETTAIPEIRQQARQLAVELLA